MSDDKITLATSAVKEIVTAIPVYQDVAQPAAREVGAALQTLAKTIHIALAPVSMLVWGYDQIKEYVADALMKRLKDVPAERLTTPPPTVAGPVLEALRFAGHEPTLREMYANLLATSLDAAKARDAHPAYVEVIRQLSPDEARIVANFRPPWAHPLVSVRAALKAGGHITHLRHFSLLPIAAGCSFPHFGEAYLDNICRLGLAEMPEAYLTNVAVYEPLETHATVLAAKSIIAEAPDLTPEIQRQVLKVTAFGQQFWRACVAPTPPTTPPQAADAK